MKGPSQLSLSLPSLKVHCSTRSPLLMTLSLINLSLYGTGQPWYSAIRIVTLSLFSSSLSKVRVSSVVSLVWRTSSPDSTGISASTSKAKAHDVSPMGYLGIVR